MKFDKLVESILNDSHLDPYKEIEKEWAEYVKGHTGLIVSPRWDFELFAKRQNLKPEDAKSALFNISNPEAIEAIAKGKYDYELSSSDFNRDFPSEDFGY